MGAAVAGREPTRQTAGQPCRCCAAACPPTPAQQRWCRLESPSRFKQVKQSRLPTHVGQATRAAAAAATTDSARRPSLPACVWRDLITYARTGRRAK